MRYILLIGSYVLQKCVEEYRTLMDESALLIEDKRIDNVIAILAQLYNFKVRTRAHIHTHTHTFAQTNYLVNCVTKSEAY